MDYSQFRQSSNETSAVSVNHKALITRALTKYPVDYALFRELLQNSADAQASSATIQFETSSIDKNISQVHQLPINRLRFSNDGLDFAKEDWKRLCEIASGNPNETKIGAFGVGFYSVFELTDEPLVHSGHQIMTFIYHGVQLHYNFTEKAPCYQKGTLIDLPYKKVGELPDLVKFIGFLVQSFMLVNLNEINLQVKYGNGDVLPLLQLNKTVAPFEMMQPPSNYQSRSPRKMLTMDSLHKSAVKISLNYLNITQMPPLTMSKGFFSFGKQLVNSLVTNSGNPEEYTTMSCDLMRVDAFVNVSVSTNYRNQMIETLLKPPPKQAVMSLLSFNGSLPSNSVSDELSAYIFPKEYNDAKIFIGFPTKQSTGLRSHLALSQVIPTMERTAVDMSNQFVKDWNSEMLYMAGVMARCSYEYELHICQSPTTKPEDAEFVVSRYRFSDSAPDRVIGLYIREGFWKSSKTTLVPTTKGVVPNDQARLPGNAKDLLRNVPIVTNTELGAELKSLGLVSEISYREIAADLGSSPVEIEFCRNAVHWLAQQWPKLDSASRAMFLTAIRVAVAVEHEGSESIEFGSCTYYHDRSKLPDEEVSSHLPPQCLSHSLASKLGMQELMTLGFEPLPAEVWVKYRLDAMRRIKSAADKKKVAAGILTVTSKAWSRLPFKHRKTVQQLLDSVACIPSQHGLVRPSEAYVSKINIFPHLPVVDSSLELPPSWLKDIGVRSSVDMRFVLEALNGSSLKWTNEDLIAYLEENSSSLKPSDWEVLRQGRFFAKSGDFKGLFLASELYAPSDELSKLGIATIAFKNWSEHSRQAELLFKVGLQKFPSAAKLFRNIKSRAETQTALRYFVRHYEEAGYSYKDIREFPVIPVTGDATLLAKPVECFSDSQMKAFDEHVLDHKWEPAAQKLGIRKRPSISNLLARILRDPAKYLSDEARCDLIFSYFSQNVGSFTENEVKQCQTEKFIPIRHDQKGKVSEITWALPSSVFLPLDSANDEDILRPLLNTIYPSRNATPFLYLIGISDRPTLTQLVEMILRQSADVFSLLKSGDEYEALLGRIESRWELIAQRPDLVDSMRTSPFLLGIKYSPTPKEKEEMFAEPKGELSLYSARDLVIVDDIVIFNQFKDKIVTAPQVDNLERLYMRLGVPRLSALLRERIRIGGDIDNETERMFLQSRIRERLELFMENTSKQINPKFKSVEVKLVQALEIHRQLPPHASVITKTSACAHPNIANQLLIVPGPHFDWIDVAAALAKLVLLRPDQDSVVVLEIQLSSELNSLEKKGYNVERVRRRHNMSKLEKKIPQLAIRDSSQDTKQPVQQPKPPSQPPMQQPLPPSQPPMQQPPPPSQPPMQQSPMQQPSMQQPSMQQPSMQQPHTGNFPPSRPPPSQPNSGGMSFGSKFMNKFRSSLSSASSSVSNQVAQATHSQPPDVASQLKQGLQKARPYSESKMIAPQHVDMPSPMRDSECFAPQKIHELQMMGTTDNGVKIFSTGSYPQPQQDELILGEALRVICGIFNYPLEAVNIYRDADVRSIAFNYNGSLFFNSCVVPNTNGVLDYYYPVMAHELAHNLVSSHGASHSFYTESYMQTTLSIYQSVAR